MGVTRAPYAAANQPLYIFTAVHPSASTELSAFLAAAQRLLPINTDRRLHRCAPLCTSGGITVLLLITAFKNIIPIIRRLSRLFLKNLQFTHYPCKLLPDLDHSVRVKLAILQKPLSDSLCLLRHHIFYAREYVHRLASVMNNA